MHQTPATNCMLTARVKEFRIPPVSDGLVLGKDAPLGFAAIERALHLLIADHFQSVPVPDDDVVGQIIIRRNLLRRVTSAQLLDFVRNRIKPLMSPTEILHLSLTVELKIEDGAP